MIFLALQGLGPPRLPVHTIGRELPGLLAVVTILQRELHGFAGAEGELGVGAAEEQGGEEEVEVAEVFHQIDQWS